MNITLIGVGMGDPGTLTLEAHAALAEAEAILGAERLLSGLPDAYQGERVPLALPEKVAAAVEARPEWKEICVVLSGDVGFYSGARQLLTLLREHEPRLVCGISTPQYFAAKLRRPWQDLRLVSAHGVHCDILAEVLNHPAALFLTGGDVTPADIAKTLCDAGLDAAEMTVGENLSYPEERILSAPAGEIAEMSFSRLCAVLVENDKTFTRPPGAAGIEDEAFSRGKAPMTKREIRALVLSLLRPGPNSILYDVGAGTGSVALEMALQSRRGHVFAVEEDPEAVRLINVNKAAFGTYNLQAIWGAAPEALEPLPAPDAAFIGGSGGRLEAIVETLLRKSPAVRLVVSAVTLETLATAGSVMREAGMGDPDIIQVAVNRSVVRGGYHMLEAKNPIFLISGGGQRDE